MMAQIRPLLLALALSTALPLLPPRPAQAQQAQQVTQATQAQSEPATLLADRVILRGDQTLVAEGNVEVYFRQNRLSARRITYDAPTGKMVIEGPLRLVEPGETGSVLVADQAELSRDLQSGLLRGARLVLARELQLAAARIEREGARTTLSRVVASSCQICAADPTPLWEIRARRVTHDMDSRQIHFDDAQFRAGGVPLFYLPHLRMPDPTVERMSGMLRPSFRTTSGLGPGIRLPYFLTLGPSQDLTFTPYIAASRTLTLETRYRRAFNWGGLEVTGAVSDDDILPDERRGYLFADLDAQLARGYRLGAQLRMVSDPAYLLDYGISDDDRLWSGVTLEKVEADKLVRARIGNTHSIRDGESNATQPTLSGEAQVIRRFRPRGPGGEAWIDWSVGALNRPSKATLDGADADTIADGRDRLRGSVVAGWRRNWVVGPGILTALEGQIAGDVIETRQDPAFARTIWRGQPSFAAEMRWPWVRASGRAAHVIEPVVQLVWSPDRLRDAPNEDSLLTEFDEGNLFSFSRYPGQDARERGLRANLGLSWTRYDAAGWTLGVTAGRVLRARNLDQFATGSGLEGTASDWLLATHLRGANGFALSNRALFDSDLNFTRDEMRLAYAGDRMQVSAGYLWMEANPLEGRPLDTSELEFETGWDWQSGWRGTFSTRYDFTAERAARVGLGLSYANECVTVDLSLSRRFTSSTSLTPETDFGVSVQLAGFGAGSRTGTARRVCAR